MPVEKSGIEGTNGGCCQLLLNRINRDEEVFGYTGLAVGVLPSTAPVWEGLGGASAHPHLLPSIDIREANVPEILFN